MFILDEERDYDVVAAFRTYREYLKPVRDQFPSRAYELAMSDWRFDPNEHSSPHDSWLEEAVVREPSRGDRHEIRAADLYLTLLGTYHDVRIHLFYSGVTALDIVGRSLENGHRDWRYDEFRVSDDGLLIHEIEWANVKKEPRWIITARDVECRSEPIGLFGTYRIVKNRSQLLAMSSLSGHSSTTVRLAPNPGQRDPFHDLTTDF